MKKEKFTCSLCGKDKEEQHPYFLRIEKENEKVHKYGVCTPCLKKTRKKKDATLEDAFIFFAGNSLEMEGNFRDIRSTRKTEGRLG